MKKFTFFFIAVLCILLQTVSYSQVNQQWVQYYNGTGNAADNSASIAFDAAGNVYVTGFGAGTGSGDDYITIKYNSAGIQQWVQYYNGPGNGKDQGAKLTVDAAGNVYVTGSSTGTGTGLDYATVKYNTNGNLQWVQRYNGPGNGDDYGVKVTVDADGNVYVTGKSAGSGSGNDFATIKYNSSGIEQWVMRYNSVYNNTDNATDIALDESGNVYVTGQSIGWGYDYATIKYSPAGVQQWVQRYNGLANSDDSPYAIAVDAAGNVYVTGPSIGSGTQFDYATIKYNSAGVQLWEKRYNYSFNGSDIAMDIALDASGNVYITGSSDLSASNPDYATVKYNASGVEQWVRRYNGPGNNADYARAIATDDFGNVYVTGFSLGIGTSYDIATIKYDTFGNQVWLERYNQSSNSLELATTLAVGACNNVYVGGYGYNAASGYDFLTIKYLQPPCAPALVSPENNSTITSLTPLMDWNISLEAVSYSIQVATNQNFSNKVIDQSGLTNDEYQVPPGILNTNSHYYWRVNAVNGAGTGMWSSVWEFSTYSTPIEKIQSLILTIDSLKNAGILNKGNANSLIVKLNAAQAKLESEQYKTAVNILGAFINEVQAFINANKLPLAIGQNLIDRANLIIDQINEMDNLSPMVTGSPKEHNLYQNFPNPFNPVTKIRVDVPTNSFVKIVVYDIRGREIVKLVNKELTAGIYEYEFNAGKLESGIYFYRMESNGFVETRKMILLK